MIVQYAVVMVVVVVLKGCRAQRRVIKRRQVREQITIRVNGERPSACAMTKPKIIHF